MVSAIIFVLCIQTILVSSLQHDSNHPESFDKQDKALLILETRSYEGVPTDTNGYYCNNYYSDSFCTDFLSGTIRQIDVCLQYDGVTSLKYKISNAGKDKKIDVRTIYYNDLECKNVATVSINQHRTECTQTDSNRYQKTSLLAVDDHCIVGRGRLR